MGQEEKTKENEARMAAELTDFRNKVAFALLFINLCFFVFAVTLKAYGDELPGYKMNIPVTLLVNNFNISYCLGYVDHIIWF